MLPYFPFGQHYNEKMGTALLPADMPLVEVDDQYTTEIALKRQLLTEFPGYYFQALPGYEIAQWDVLELILRNLAQAFPTFFSLQQNQNHWQWANHQLRENWTFTVGDSATLSGAPLDWVGRQIQDDLLLLVGTDARLVAGLLCFANDWSLNDKMGLPFWQIHAPITPIVEPMMRAAQHLMARLPAGRSVWRLNWSIKLSNQLDMTTRHEAELRQQYINKLDELTPDTIGQQLYLRVERQTLTRLPRSGAILFGVHTYQNLLAHETADPDRAKRMVQVVGTTPPAMLDYKSMTAFLPMLLDYLTARTHE